MLLCAHRYVERFKTAVHFELISRVCLGSVVVDREVISGLPGGGVADCMAFYTVCACSLSPNRNVPDLNSPCVFAVHLSLPPHIHHPSLIRWRVSKSRKFSLFGAPGLTALRSSDTEG